jgi:pectinesterase
MTITKLAHQGRAPKQRAVTAALAAAGLLAAQLAHGASLTVTVSNDLDIARPSETVTIPWTEVNRALPGAQIQHIAVKDAAGHVLPHQVTNVAPQAKDPQGIGAAYGELLFQHSFAAGEKSASFTVEKIDALAPPFPSQVSARYVPERLDDFAWENDKIGHRTYGPALAAPAPAGSGKEVLVTSGLDLWFKRVPYPIVDRWYNKGHDHYHHDEGEGMDLYNVGRSRGAGGVGVWDGAVLYTGTNYAGWQVLANGPVRAIFELRYDGWDAAGVRVSEVKRFTVDAGQQLDRIDSTFSYSSPTTLNIAVGLNKTPSDKGQQPKQTLDQDSKAHALVQWVEQASNGDFGVAVVLPTTTGYAEDKLNHLIVAPAASGKALTYLVGGAWSRAGEITTREQWRTYVANAAARYNSPIHVSLQAK